MLLLPIFIFILRSMGRCWRVRFRFSRRPWALNWRRSMNLRWFEMIIINFRKRILFTDIIEVGFIIFAVVYMRFTRNAKWHQ